MQARIKRAEIEAFKTFAQEIKGDKGSLPILSYLKVTIDGDKCSMFKTNLKAFVQRTFDSDDDDCQFLVDENILFNFCELSDAEYINFHITGNRILITDGRHDTNSPTERSQLYPALDTQGGDEWKPLPKKVLNAISICAQIIFDEELSGPKSCVFIGNKCVVGSDATIAYIQHFEEELPQIVLRKGVANAISKLNDCKHCANRSYDLFSDNNTLYGFSKCETAFFDLKTIFKTLVDFPDFTLNKSSLIKWNTYALASCQSKTIAATWEAENGKLNLQIVDEKFEIDTKSFIDLVSGGVGKFKFSPDMLNNLLKCLPSEQVFFYPGEKRYYLTDATNSFMSAIMLII